MRVFLSSLPFKQPQKIEYTKIGFVLEKAMKDKSLQERLTTDKKIQTHVNPMEKKFSKHTSPY